MGSNPQHSVHAPLRRSGTCCPSSRQHPRQRPIVRLSGCPTPAGSALHLTTSARPCAKHCAPRHVATQASQKLLLPPDSDEPECSHKHRRACTRTRPSDRNHPALAPAPARTPRTKHCRQHPRRSPPSPQAIILEGDAGQGPPPSRPLARPRFAEVIQGGADDTRVHPLSAPRRGMRATPPAHITVAPASAHTAGSLRARSLAAIRTVRSRTSSPTDLLASSGRCDHWPRPPPLLSQAQAPCT